MGYSKIFPLGVSAMLSLGFVACKDSKSSTNEIKGPVGDIAAAVKTESTVSLDERAAALGYPQYMPESTEVFTSFYNGKRVTDALLESDLLALVSSQDDSFPSGEELKSLPQAKMILQLLGEELHIAFGEGSAEQMVNLNKGQFWIDSVQGNQLLSLWLGILTGSDSLDAFQSSAGLNFGEHGKEVLQVIEKAKMPPVTISLKVSDAEFRSEILQQLRGLIVTAKQQLDPEKVGFAKLNEVKRGDLTYNGLLIDGEKLIDAEGEKIISTLPEDIRAEAEAALKKRDLQLLVGEKGEYLVLYLGDSEEGFQFAESVSSSALAKSELSLLDPYIGKELLATSYVSGDLFDRFVKSQPSFSGTLHGVTAAVEESDKLGDTRDTVALFKEAGKNLEKLSSKNKAQASVGVGFFENGLSFESFGGAFPATADYASERSLASLVESEGAILAMNWVADEEGSKLASSTFEYIIEGLYVLMKSAVDGGAIKDQNFQQAGGILGIYETSFVQPTANIWKALKDEVGSGLGSENTFIFDLQANFPDVMGGGAEPNPDTQFLPRLAFAQTVTDRTKLQSGWGIINTELNKVLEAFANMGTGPGIAELPMPQNKESGDLKTWFYPLPIASNDLNPSVSVSDSVMFVSSSSALSEALAAKVGAKKPGGCSINVNFDLLAKKLGKIFKTSEGRAQAESLLEEKGIGAQELELMLALLKSTGGLGKFSSETSLQNGVLRNSSNLSLK